MVKVNNFLVAFLIFIVSNIYSVQIVELSENSEDNRMQETTTALKNTMCNKENQVNAAERLRVLKQRLEFLREVEHTRTMKPVNLRKLPR